MPQTVTKFFPRRLHTAFSRGSWAGSSGARALAAVISGNPAYVSYFDDFLGTGAGTWPASQNWSYPATVGTGTESISVSTAALGGALKVTSGATTDNSAVQHVGLHWRGTEGVYGIWKVTMASVASVKLELGFSDSITNDCCIATKATPTFTATDCASFVFDTADDTNLTFITGNAGATGANADATFTMDTNPHVYEILVLGGQATGWVDGIFVGAGAITSTAPLSPYAATVTRTGSAKTNNFDYMGAFGPRG